MRVSSHFATSPIDLMVNKVKINLDCLDEKVLDHRYKIHVVLGMTFKCFPNKMLLQIKMMDGI